MFVSRTDGKATSTIRVNVGQDLLVSGALLFVGLWLVVGSIPHPNQHYIALAIGLLLLVAGFGLGNATLRLIFRGWHAYDNATRKDK
jgi:O-antigen/teichoic acid export membrane protein